MHLLFFFLWVCVSMAHASPTFTLTSPVWTNTTLNCSNGVSSFPYASIRMASSTLRVAISCINGNVGGIRILNRANTSTPFLPDPTFLNGVQGGTSQVPMGTFDMTPDGNTIVIASVSLSRFHWNGTAWAQLGGLFTVPNYDFYAGGYTAGNLNTLSLSSDGTYVISFMINSVSSTWNVYTCSWNGTSWTFIRSLVEYPPLQQAVDLTEIQGAFTLEWSGDNSTLAMGWASPNVVQTGYQGIVYVYPSGNVVSGWTGMQTLAYPYNASFNTNYLQGINLYLSTDGTRLAYAATNNGYQPYYTFVYDRQPNGTYIPTLASTTTKFLGMNGNGNMLVVTDLGNHLYLLLDQDPWKLVAVTGFTAAPDVFGISSDGSIQMIVSGVYTMSLLQTVDTLAPTPYPSQSPTPVHVPSRAPSLIDGFGVADLDIAGFEYPNYIPILFQTENHDDIANFSFYIASFPSDGTLFRLVNDSSYVPVPNDTLALFPYNASNNASQTVYFQGDVHFFTRNGTDGYENGLGLSFNGCYTNEAPGCPVVFTYGVMYMVGGDTRFSKENGTCTIQVENVLSPLPYPDVALNTQNLLIGSNSTMEGWIYLIDYDQDLYKVLVYYAANQGLIGSFLNLTQFAATGLIPLSCTLTITAGCNSFSYYGYPTQINDFLQYQFYQATKTNSETGLFKWLMWKPAPNGITSSNVQNVLAYDVPDQYVYIQIDTYGATYSPTISDTGSSIVNTFLTVFYVIIGVCAPIDFCFCLYFCRGGYRYCCETSPSSSRLGQPNRGRYRAVDPMHDA